MTRFGQVMAIDLERDCNLAMLLMAERSFALSPRRCSAEVIRRRGA